MNKQAVSSPPLATPWLEHFAEQGRPVQKTLLASFPFSIGRNETTDLPINSTCVSREHAVIVRAGDTYRVRDLDSRNGTSINGQRIEEATLSDGDILAIADVEFTFFSGVVQAPRQTVTQVIGFRHSDATRLKSADLIRSARRLQETLLQGAHRVSFSPIASLNTGVRLGIQASSKSSLLGPQAAEADRRVLGAQSRLASRLREAFFWRAAEMCLKHPDLKLFLPLESSDFELTFLENLLSRLTDMLPDPGCLVLDLPDGTVSAVHNFQAFYSRVRSQGVGLCYNDFAAGKARLEEHADNPPDYIRLARSFMRGLWQDGNRRSQAAKLFEACRTMGCEAIAVDIENDQQAESLQEIGCLWGMGTHFATSLDPSPCGTLPSVRADLILA